MKTDKYKIEIKVGDFVLLDSYTGMEFGTSAGTIQQIKKIGTRRIHFNTGHTNLRKAQFEYLTKYTLISVSKQISRYGSFYYPLFVRTATNEQMYNAIISGLKKGTDKEISNALIKNETYKYENLLSDYKLRNSGHSFSEIWSEKSWKEVISLNKDLENKENI